MAFFTPRPDGLIDFTDDSGTTVPMAGYMAEQLQANGVQPQPAPAPPPDMGAPAPAPPMLQLNDPSLQPVAIPPAGGVPAPEVAPAPVAAPPTDMVPASADPGAVSPTAPVANASLAGATPIDEDTAGRMNAKVDPSTLQFGGGQTSQPNQSGYSQPNQSQAIPENSPRALQLAMGGGGGGGFGLAGRTVQHSIPLSGRARDEMIDAQTAQMGAARDQAGAAEEMLQAQAQVREEARRQEFERQKRKAAKALELQKKRDDALADIPKGIDPNAWDKSGGVGRLLAAISIGLGGYASGMTGMQNPGIQLLQAAQRDSVEQQREEIRLAEQRGEVADNLYQKAMAEFGGDPVLAESMVNLAEAHAFMNTLQSKLDSAQDKALRADIEKALADAKAVVAQQQAEMDGKIGTVADQYAAMQTADPLDRLLKEAQYRKLVSETGQQDSRQEKTYRESQVILPDGSRAWAKDAAAANLAQGVIESEPQIMENMDRLMELVGTTGRGVSPELKAEIGALVQSNKMLFKQLEDLGAITSADQELISPLTGGDVGSFASMSASQKKALEVAIRHVKRRLASAHHILYRDPQLTRPMRPTITAGEKAPE